MCHQIVVLKWLQSPEFVTLTHCDSRPKSDVTNLGEHIFLLSQAYLTITLELFKIHVRPDVY